MMNGGGQSQYSTLQRGGPSGGSLSQFSTLQRGRKTSEALSSDPPSPLSPVPPRFVGE